MSANIRHRQCPNCKQSVQIVKDGSFFRPSDSRRIQRYKCKNCGKRFSNATFQLAYRQNKRKVNHPLRALLASGISMRRAAKLLKIRYSTVARKVEFLSRVAMIKHQRMLETCPKVTAIQFDDLITLEHTKCKPLSVTIAVDEMKRTILGVEVSSMPAFGHLAKISIRKYGPRKDEREQGIRSLLSKIQVAIDLHATITTDEHQLYPKNIKRYFPEAVHEAFKGARGSVYGQGELKKIGYDPLFAINHTCAMFRANVNRLIRKSWCTTKIPKMLLHHLNIFMEYYNSELL